MSTLASTYSSYVKFAGCANVLLIRSSNWQHSSTVCHCGHSLSLQYPGRLPKSQLFRERQMMSLDETPSKQASSHEAVKGMTTDIMGQTELR